MMSTSARRLEAGAFQNRLILEANITCEGVALSAHHDPAEPRRVPRRKTQVVVTEASLGSDGP
jgi:hypothetical protein